MGYAENRKSIEKKFTKKSLKKGSTGKHESPCGKYDLEISYYDNGKGYWDYSRGIATKAKTKEVLADVKRNYGHFWHCWVKHPNGDDYLLCGEDYQGYTIINLTDKREIVVEPSHEFVSFCWIGVEFDEENEQLIVEGCYWGSPFEEVIFDFSIPENTPLPEISRRDLDFDDDED